MEGEVTQLSARGPIVYLTLRDPVAVASLQVLAPRDVLASLTPPLTPGSRVVVWAQPAFATGRGSLSLRAYEVRRVGLGELLARVEQLRGRLAAEGLFDPARKKPLPFLPRAVGLITGRAGAAERDVVENARRRWPAVRFEVREVPVQGTAAVPAIIRALGELDGVPAVDVIVIARGGGSTEDLLVFSEESLCRAVAACRAPVVSAIGHEQDTPLVDLVADARASTPTDAGKLVVPDVAEEVARVTRSRTAIRRLLAARIEREEAWLAAARARPGLADPQRRLGAWLAEVLALRERLRRRVATDLDAGLAHADQLAARLAALSPAATLQRGYAIVQRGDHRIVRAATQVCPGDPLDVRLAAGRLRVTVSEPATP